MKKIELSQLFSDHKEKFRQKLIEALAEKNSLTPEQIIVDHKDFIEQYIAERHEAIEQLINRINLTGRPVLLNIRRDRTKEDKCKLCEGNQPNVDTIAKKYEGKIDIIEVPEERPEGGGLYHIIFHEESGEKKLPLTAVINRGEILKFWAGKTVEPVVYEIYIRKILIT